MCQKSSSSREWFEEAGRFDNQAVFCEKSGILYQLRREMMTTITSDGQVLVNGRDLNKKYHGYRWRSTSSDEYVYVGEADPSDKIIEAFVKSPGGIPGVVVVRGSDIHLYRLLQIRDPWRFHPVTGMIYMFMTIVLFFVLFVVQLLVGVYLLSITEPDLRILLVAFVSLGLSFFETQPLLSLLGKGKILFGMIRISVYVVWSVVVGGKGFQYYRDFFQRCSDLFCKDKAETAVMMANLMRFLP